MRKFTIITIFVLFLIQNALAQFSSVKLLKPLAVSTNTREKPQAKVWMHDNKHWTVLSNNSGSHVFRLDGDSTWTKVLTLSGASNQHSDCKVVGNVVHIFIFQGKSSDLVSIEYVPSNSTYKLWTGRTSTVSVSTDSDAETATIDIAANGRMWLAYDTDTAVAVRWSDSPYSTWSRKIVISDKIWPDDIGAVIAFPMFNKVGVFWSNQKTERSGFRMHKDSDPDSIWSADERPASQSALNIRYGFSDDHMNFKVGSNGTLYCAVKTGYDTPGYPKISLLIRRPNGTWDNLYGVSELGTRGIVLVNEAKSKLRVIYSESEVGGNIYYKESALSPISFGPQITLISGIEYNNATSIKNNHTFEVAIIASTSNEAVSVLAVDNPPIPDVPTLASPANNATGVAYSPTLTWNTALYAKTYQVQVSTSSNFQTLFYDASNITTLATTVPPLAYSTKYYWRVRSFNTTGASTWSTVRNFTTVAVPVPAAPLQDLPANTATAITLPAVLSWTATVNAISYRVQLSTSSSFSTPVSDVSNINTLKTTVAGLKYGTKYYWRVRGVNTSGNGSWSAVRNCTTMPIPIPVTPPTLASPANYATGVANPPTLSWNAGDYAESYQVQVATSSDFISPVSDISNITTLSRSISGLNWSTQYYWRVRTINASGASNWSAVYSCTTMQIPIPVAPGLASPAANATGVAYSPTLSWDAVTHAATYQMQLATSSDFFSRVADISNLTTLNTQVTALAYSTQYFWRVRAANSTGVGNWSAVRSFTTVSPPPIPGVPTLSSPSNGSTSIAIARNLSWNAASNAYYYQMQLATSPDFLGMVNDITNITTLSAPVSGLAYSTKYYWRVRAFNTTGASTWSTVRNFTTVAVPVPAAPVQNLPANAATAITLPAVLSWNASVNAASYRVQISTSTSFSTPLLDIKNITALNTSVAGLNNGIKYYWRVRGVNPTGSGSWSPTRNFTTVTNGQPATPTGGLVGHWEMEGTGTTLTDASANGNHATTSGNPTRVTGISGQALQVNGTSQYASVPSSTSLNVSNAVTLAAWIKPEQTGTAQVVMKKGETGNADGYELSLTSTGKILFRYNQVSAGDNFKVQSNTLHPTNGSTWMHIAATFDGTTITIYVDGNLDKTLTLASPPPINNNSLPLAIGAQSSGSNRFKGAIDDARIYNVALSAVEISSLASTSSSRMASGPQEQLPLEAVPNPFHTAAKINFTAPETGEYAVILYNMAGNPVRVLKRGKANAGEKLSADLDGSKLFYGLYMVRLQTSKSSHSLKLIRD